MLIILVIIFLVLCVISFYYHYAYNMNAKLQKRQEYQFASPRKKPYKRKLIVTSQLSVISFACLLVVGIPLFDNNLLIAVGNEQNYYQIIKEQEAPRTFVAQTVEEMSYYEQIETQKRAIEFQDSVYLCCDTKMMRFASGFVAATFNTNNAIRSQIAIDSGTLYRFSIDNNNQEMITIHDLNTLAIQHQFSTASGQIVYARLSKQTFDALVVVNKINDIEQIKFTFNEEEHTLSYNDIYYMESLDNEEMLVHIQVNTRKDKTKLQAILLPQFYINASNNEAYINYNLPDDEEGFARCMVVKYDLANMRIVKCKTYGGTTYDEIKIADTNLFLNVYAKMNNKNKWTIYRLDNFLDKIDKQQTDLSKDEVWMFNQDAPCIITIDPDSDNPTTVIILFKTIANGNQIKLKYYDQNLGLFIIGEENNTQIECENELLDNKTHLIDWIKKDNFIKAILENDGYYFYAFFNIETFESKIVTYAKSEVDNIFFTENNLITLSGPTWNVEATN